MTIHVTQEHIDRGECHQGTTCAISQAIMDAFSSSRNKVFSITTGLERIHIFFMNERTVCHKLDDVSRAFVRQFDHDKSQAKPFSFDIPDHLLPKAMRPDHSTLLSGFAATLNHA